MKHKSLINHFSQKPHKIEPGFRTFQKEFSLGHGRIDIIGKDKDGNLCLVEVKTRDSEISLGKRQITKYKSELANFIGLIGVEMAVRGIVVTSTKVIHVGITKSFVSQPKTKIPLDIPTSREVFGLRSNMKNH